LLVVATLSAAWPACAQDLLRRATALAYGCRAPLAECPLPVLLRPPATASSPRNDANWAEVRARRLPRAELEHAVSPFDAQQMDYAPPLRPLMDPAMTQSNIVAFRAAHGSGGKGVIVGVVDTGIDARHADFRDDRGHTRIAWLLDFSRPAVGLHPELEQAFGCTDPLQSACAVLNAADIDAALEGAGAGFVPRDELGHGTHVASLAAGDGRPAGSDFVGAAPEATLVVVRVSGSDARMAEGDVLNGVRFVFDRADALGAPAVVNLSLGRDFGPHDGSSLLEQSLADLVGVGHLGRAIVVAAGDSASGAPRHARLTLSSAARAIAIEPSEQSGSGGTGSVFVWLMVRDASDVKVALRGPRELSLEPSPLGQVTSGTDASGAVKAEFAPPPDGRVEREGSGALATTLVLQGSWQASDRFELLISGQGYVDAWLQNEAVGPGLFFPGGSSAGSIMIPASHPELLAVGCTVDQDHWKNAAGELVQAASDGPDSSCRFGSYGPNLLGDLKPELSAPGAFVIGALSADATTDHAASAFAFARGACATRDCGVIDAQHAIASGTSMSAAIVSGAAALLFERYPRLEQRELVRALQAGSRWPSGSVAHDAQVGTGVMDLLAADQSFGAAPSAAVDAETSRVVLSSERIAASPNSRVTGTIALRAANGAVASDSAAADLLAVHFAGKLLAPPRRLAPSLLQFELSAHDDGASELPLDVRWGDAGLGIGATSGTRFLLLDRTEAEAKLSLAGGCAVSSLHASAPESTAGMLCLVFWLSRRRARAKTQLNRSRTSS
jgi:subtilisin family serine protease